MTSSNFSHGKRGLLRLGFELDSRGRSILRDLYRQAPLIVQQALYFDEQMPSLPCVYILSAGGPVVEGDSYEQHFSLKENSSAHISTGAATKVAQMQGGKARMRQSIRLAAGAYMEFLPEAVIPCQGADYEVESEIVADESAALFLSEIILSGRRYSGERFRYRRLAFQTRILRPDGEVVYVDSLEVEPQSWDILSRGVMASYEVFASVIILAPESVVQDLREELQPYMDEDMALGINLLSYDAGLKCTILGQHSSAVKAEVRRLCSCLRMKVKGCVLPEEFVWK